MLNTKNLLPYDEENYDVDEIFEQELSSDNMSNKASEILEIENLSSDDSEFQYFGQFAVNNDWMTENYGELKSTHESFEIKQLRENIYDIFRDSVYFNKYANDGKVAKQDMLTVFLYFYDRIKDKDRYSNVEKFIEIADFMNMNYTVLYKELPLLYKQKIIFDIDSKLGILKTKNLKKLF